MKKFQTDFYNIPVSELSVKQAYAELTQLTDLLKSLDHAYYNNDEPLVDDAVYDKLRQRFNKIESQFPHLKKEDSASQKVGIKPTGGLKKCDHLTPMLSLDNVFNAEEFDKFIKRIQRYLDLKPDVIDNLHFIAEPKIDGLSVNLVYRQGKFVQASTRGDGITGEDVTENIKTLKDLPLELLGDYPDIIEIRGEVYISKQDFLDLNNEQKKNNKRLFANPRNAAAGSLRQLDPEVTRSRPLSLFVYAQGYSDIPVADTHKQLLHKLQKWGFSINSLFRVVKNAHDAELFQKEIDTKRSDIPYDIDGVVYKVNSISLQNRLGFVGRSPRWAVAWKFLANYVITSIEKIDIQVGRTGALTPVAILKPVNIGGVMITRATLHNEEEIRNKDIREHDHVIVERSGDVIPKILKVDDSSYSSRNREPPFQFPTHCPVCGSIAEKPDGEVISRCTGGLTCKAQIKERLIHFCSKKAFNIKGMGEKTVNEFFNMNLITQPADIFHLKDHRKTILEKEGWGECSLNNLLTEVDQRREITLDRFIHALGIRYVGINISRLLANYYNTYDNWKNQMIAACKEGSDERLILNSIEGIGSSISDEIIIFFTEEHNMQTLHDLEKELTIRDIHINSTGILSGKVVVFTGTLSGMSRSEAKHIAEKLGAKVTDSVSQKTDFVIVGQDGGSKMRKAEKLGIKCLSEQEWNKLWEMKTTSS